MAKRFADTDSYDKRWFRTLPILYKVAWDYCLKKCSPAGILSLDTELAAFQIGEAVDWPEFFATCGDRVLQLPDGKVFLTTFIDFQYGELSEDCNPHKAVIKELKKNGLWEGYLKGTFTLQDKDKDKDQDKDQDKKGDARGKPKFAPPAVAEVAAYVATRTTKIDPQAFCDFYASKGWKVGNQPMKDWKASVRTWERNDTRGSPSRSDPNDPRGNIALMNRLISELPDEQNEVPNCHSTGGSLWAESE